MSLKLNIRFVNIIFIILVGVPRMVEEIEVILITGRTIEQGVGLEVGKTSEKYSTSVNYVELNSDDAASLNAKSGSHIEVANVNGRVVLYCHPVQSLRPGFVFIPYGPWANQLLSTYSAGTGTPQFKGVSAKVRLAENMEVLTIESLVKSLRGGL